MRENTSPATPRGTAWNALSRRVAAAFLGSVFILTATACDSTGGPAAVVNGCGANIRVYFDEWAPGVDVDPASWERLAVTLGPNDRREGYAIHQDGEYLLIVYPKVGDPVVKRIPFSDGVPPDEVVIEGALCGGS